MNKQTETALKMAKQLRGHNDERLYREADILMIEAAEMIESLVEQPAQEPVAWVGSLNEFDMRRLLNEGYELSTALYTYPAPSCSCKDKK